MLDYRGSAEVVGMALLTLAVGQLFTLWLDNYIFGLYSWFHRFGTVSHVCAFYEKNELDKHKHLQTVRK